jgi:hypothetical protein
LIAALPLFIKAPHDHIFLSRAGIRPNVAMDDQAQKAI